MPGFRAVRRAPIVYSGRILLYQRGVRLPRTIAGYEFVQLLGVGGFGAVYRAILRGDLGFEQEVAVKVLDADRARLNPDLVASLVNEARILSSVQHPNVVQARHFLQISDDVLGDTWMLVMEMVRGQTLRRVLHADRQVGRILPIKAPLQVLSELSDGLHFAHRLTDHHGEAVGLVHRDLKPENIVVTNEGRIKILDFGIAYAKKRAGRTTQDGRIIGTPHYMSPEQLRGEVVDRRSDLYSLGTIGFEMLSGESFVPRATNAHEALELARDMTFDRREDVLRKALSRRYDRDGEGALAEDITSLLRDLLQVDPGDRPELAGQVFDRLEAMSAHRPSVGRGHLRVWVEQQNVRDRQEPPSVAGAPGDVQRTRALIRPGMQTLIDPEQTIDEALEEPTLPGGEPTMVVSELRDAPKGGGDRWKLVALILAAALAIALLALLAS